MAAPRIPAASEAMKMAIFAAAKSAAIGKRLARDEQRHGETNAPERTRATELTPRILRRFHRDAKAHPKPGRQQDSDGFAHNQPQDDREHQTAVRFKNAHGQNHPGVRQRKER